jgi:hypothetical protein
MGRFEPLLFTVRWRGVQLAITRLKELRALREPTKKMLQTMSFRDQLVSMDVVSTSCISHAHEGRI